jgi:putative FmdB family regulatory protein
MPTYDYKCDACGSTFERFQSITAEPSRKCPQCGKLKARRLISPGAGLIFKGSGFYITDYRSEGYKDAAKAESGAADSKPADAPKSPGKSNSSTTEAKSAASASSSAASDAKPASKGGAKNQPKKK